MNDCIHCDALMWPNFSLFGSNSVLLDNIPLTWNRNFIPNSDRPGAALNQPPFCASRSLDERERRDERTQPLRGSVFCGHIACQQMGGSYIWLPWKSVEFDPDDSDGSARVTGNLFDDDNNARQTRHSVPRRA